MLFSTLYSCSTNHVTSKLSAVACGLRRGPPLEALLVAARRPEGSPIDLQPATRSLHRCVDALLERLERIMLADLLTKAVARPLHLELLRLFDAYSLR